MNILLVEDDAGIGRVVSRGLTAEGFDVSWTRSGVEGQRRLESEPYAAAILDLSLRDAEGMEICSGVRRAGVSTPILMLTARGGLDDKLEGFRRGADDYLTKPFAFDELVARLKALSHRSRTPTVLKAGPLTLDRLNRTARAGDVAVTLPQREFEMLACLVETAGAAAPRELLLERVWGATSDVSDNTLDVYVGYIRRRLSKLQYGPRVETVRGVGYRLVI